MNKPIIGITIGDPSGAGPEICLKAFKNTDITHNCRPIFFGDEKVIKRVMPIIGCQFRIKTIDNIEQYEEDCLNLISLNNMNEDYEFAKVQAVCGRAAFEFIESAIQHALENKIDAVATGPINKEALNLAGINYSGHTEIFADMTKTKDYAMLLVGGPLKVIHVSTHVSLREACDRAKKERILTVIRLANKAMLDMGINEPQIGVAGLNPHSGENGLFGNEELEEIMPAIQEAQKSGINVKGPVPPDTAFLHCKNGKYDIIVAMYHDQGHIPLKILDFMGGVNITVGLPIIRTSVDHGTVYGKAGKGTADETSMVKAVELAIQFANNRSISMTEGKHEKG